jgi:hypothetical protein
LTTSPYKAAVDFDIRYCAPDTRQERKRETYIAQIDFVLRDAVPNAFVRVNLLGLEARAAREEAKKLPKDTAQASALQAQACAENVRDHFSRALPQLFNQTNDPSRTPSSRHTWTR